MLSIKTDFDKNSFHKGQKEALFLVELLGTHASNSKKAKNKKLKLNVAMAIDISGSMNEPLFRESYAQPVAVWANQHHISNQWDNLQQRLKGGNMCCPQPAVIQMPYIAPKVCHSRKIDQAKLAATKAIDAMDNGDIVSIVLFDDRTTVLVEATVLSESNRNTIKRQIANIAIRGGTNLHEGWVVAAAEASKNLGNGYLSSVLVLSDGQTLQGITNSDVIAGNVAKIQKNGIMTTTFGIGEGFNEDLLQAMSTAGAGNFYYIDDDNKIVKMFEDEFAGLSNISASDIKLSFKFAKGFEVAKQFNGFEAKDLAYVIPSISNQAKKSLLFNVKLNIKATELKEKLKGNPSITVGELHIEYKDEDGKARSEKIELKNELVSKKDWEEQEFTSEVKVQETLLIIADNKTQATKFLDMGDIAGAQGLLRSSANFAASTGYNDSRLTKEFETLNNTVTASATMSANSFRKDISNQSYMTKNSKG